MPRQTSTVRKIDADALVSEMSSLGAVHELHPRIEALDSPRPDHRWPALVGLGLAVVAAGLLWTTIGGATAMILKSTG